MSIMLVSEALGMWYILAYIVAILYCLDIIQFSSCGFSCLSILSVLLWLLMYSWLWTLAQPLLNGIHCCWPVLAEPFLKKYSSDHVRVLVNLPLELAWDDAFCCPAGYSFLMEDVFMLVSFPSRLLSASCITWYQGKNLMKNIFSCLFLISY